MEKQFLTKTWAEWEPIFKANEIPYEKLYLPEDILADEEVYASDILRKVHYDAFGEKAIPTSPIRLDSMGDPVLHKSRPIGYDTAEVMHEYGYSDEDIQAWMAILLRAITVPIFPIPFLSQATVRVQSATKQTGAVGPPNSHTSPTAPP